MKAKEYLEQFKKIKSQTNDIVPLLEVAKQILEQFVIETKELFKKRNIQNKNSRDALIHEMNCKWLILSKNNEKYFPQDIYKIRIRQEEFFKEKEQKFIRHGVIDSMADVKELQKEALYKFRNLRNQK